MDTNGHESVYAPKPVDVPVEKMTQCWGLTDHVSQRFVELPNGSWRVPEFIQFDHWPDAEGICDEKCHSTPESPSGARFARVLAHFLFVAHAVKVTLVSLHFKGGRKK